MQTKSAACGKRLLALVLAIVMVCSLLPVSAVSYTHLTLPTTSRV